MTTPDYNARIEGVLTPYGISLNDSQRILEAEYRQRVAEAAVSPDDVPESSAPERVIVKPAANSRLEGLLCELSGRQAAAAEADQKLKELKAAIIAEAEELYPGADVRPTEAYEIPATQMYPALVISYKKSWYLPADAIRDNLPQVYEAFKKPKTYTELRVRPTGKGTGGRRK